MGTRTQDAVGRQGEGLAARALADLGWVILDRNWRCALGEIDLVALDADEVVVVEVKTRRSTTYGTPAEAVTGAKLARLRKLAAAWLAAQARCYSGVRVDVVSVFLGPGGCRIERLEGVG